MKCYGHSVCRRRYREKEEDIIIAKLDKFEDVLYRRYLAKSYGKRKQMVSGIHFNFEYSPEFICSLFHAQTTFDSLEQFKTDLYLKASRHYMRYRWLITYLFGASPQAKRVILMKISVKDRKT